MSNTGNAPSTANSLPQASPDYVYETARTTGLDARSQLRRMLTILEPALDHLVTARANARARGGVDSTETDLLLQRIADLRDTYTPAAGIRDDDFPSLRRVDIAYPWDLSNSPPGQDGTALLTAVQRDMAEAAQENVANVHILDHTLTALARDPYAREQLTTAIANAQRNNETPNNEQALVEAVQWFPEFLRTALPHFAAGYATALPAMQVDADAIARNGGRAAVLALQAVNGETARLGVRSASRLLQASQIQEGLVFVAPYIPAVVTARDQFQPAFRRRLATLERERGALPGWNTTMRRAVPHEGLYPPAVEQLAERLTRAASEAQIPVVELIRRNSEEPIALESSERGLLRDAIEFAVVQAGDEAAVRVLRRAELRREQAEAVLETASRRLSIVSNYVQTVSLHGFGLNNGKPNIAVHNKLYELEGRATAASKVGAFQAYVATIRRHEDIREFLDGEGSKRNSGRASPGKNWTLDDMSPQVLNRLAARYEDSKTLAATDFSSDEAEDELADVQGLMEWLDRQFSKELLLARNHAEAIGTRLPSAAVRDRDVVALWAIAFAGGNTAAGHGARQVLAPVLAAYAEDLPQLGSDLQFGTRHSSQDLATLRSLRTVFTYDKTIHAAETDAVRSLAQERRTSAVDPTRVPWGQRAQLVSQHVGRFTSDHPEVSLTIVNARVGEGVNGTLVPVLGADAAVQVGQALAEIANRRIAFARQEDAWTRGHAAEVYQAFIGLEPSDRLIAAQIVNLETSRPPDDAPEEVQRAWGTSMGRMHIIQGIAPAIAERLTGLTADFPDLRLMMSGDPQATPVTWRPRHEHRQELEERRRSAQAATVAETPAPVAEPTSATQEPNIEESSTGIGQRLLRGASGLMQSGRAAAGDIAAAAREAAAAQRRAAADAAELVRLDRMDAAARRRHRGVELTDAEVVALADPGIREIPEGAVPALTAGQLVQVVSGARLWRGRAEERANQMEVILDDPSVAGMLEGDPLNGDSMGLPNRLTVDGPGSIAVLNEPVLEL